MENYNTKTFKENSLKKYRNKNVIEEKWIKLYKMLNESAASYLLNTVIMESMKIAEYVMEIVLDEQFIMNRFYDNVQLLIEKGYKISSEDFAKLKRSKWLRNMSAHHTMTSVGAVIDYKSAKESFIVIGNLLVALGYLSAESVVPSIERLQVKLGDVIGDVCIINEKLGEGGNGKVFKAYHKRLDCDVAVKEINSDKEANLVDNEKSMLIKLKHSGIPQIFDVISENHTQYIIMEYISGCNLEEYVEKIGPLPKATIKRFAIQLLKIIQYIHSYGNGILCMDLKPSNIMVDSNNQIYLIDFGIVKDKDHVTSNDEVSGTFSYSSPEQINGEAIDERADIYSIGGIIYYMAEADHPNHGHTRRYRRDTNAKIIKIIEKSMNLNINERYENVELIISELSYNNDKKNRIKKLVSYILLSMVLAIAYVSILSLFSGGKTTEGAETIGSAEADGIYSFDGEISTSREGEIEYKTIGKDTIYNTYIEDRLVSIDGESTAKKFIVFEMVYTPAEYDMYIYDDIEFRLNMKKFEIDKPKFYTIEIIGENENYVWLKFIYSCEESVLIDSKNAIVELTYNRKIIEE